MPALSSRLDDFTRRSGLVGEAALPESVEVPADTADAVLRVYDEALSNVWRHAAARHVRVQLAPLPEGWALSVEDDGRGLGAASRDGMGMNNMRERSRAIGARFEVHGGAGGGTRRLLLVPGRDIEAMSTTPLKVLLVDDHAVVRQGLRAYLELQPGIEVCAEADSARQAAEQALRCQPDVALVDLVMPDEDGLQATRRIRSVSPRTRVLVLTSSLGLDDVQPAFDAGASGYQLKEIGGSELLDCLWRVARGERVLHPRLGASAPQPRTRMNPRPPPWPRSVRVNAKCCC
ncbi:ATP-binding response regulator [Pseudofulvimonas gallinarii]|uniref:ATP-binding response regulator n=1 Tax=Pseudofulvimonas gallinarii TaxID=634155 RepID=UPI0035E68D85